LEVRGLEARNWMMKNQNSKNRVMSFEDLEAWQMSRQLVNALYALTRVTSLSKDFRLCSQIQAAGVSIMSNIAEGFERIHLQEKIQFYNVARGSAGEVRSLLYVVSDNFGEAVPDAEHLRGRATSVGKVITGLLNSTVRRRGIVPHAIFALLSPISCLLTSVSSHLR
jgi:four helix bundle protein